MSAQERPTVEPEPAAHRAIVSLARAMKNVSFYEVGHPVVREVVGEVVAELGQLFTYLPEVAIKLVDGYLVAQDRPLVGESAPVGNLVGACHRRRVESIVFRQGLEVDDVSALVELLAADPSEIEAAGGVGAALAARGIERVAVERLQSQPSSQWRWVYTSALDALRGAAMGVRTGRPLDIRGIEASVRGLVNDILTDGSVVHNLHSMKGADEYTFAHALHICILSIELGRQLDLPRARLEELGVAGLLHDIGKIHVPLEVLRKPAALTEREFALMGRHPVDGAVALAGEPALPEVAAVVAFEHHVHYDYSGYPRLGERRPLHLYSLMARVADVYDALTTMRPYRPPMPPRQAIEVIRQQFAGRLEPRLLERFLEMLGPHPWGSLLRLPEGRLAVVTRPHAAEPGNPFVRLLVPENGGLRATDEEVPLGAVAPLEAELEHLDPYAERINLTALLHGGPGG